jgi:iron complex transport system substrate-binding protein
MEPLMVAGHWMPDVVEMAGGRSVLGTAGEPTRTVEWDTLRETDPDALALMPCGFTIEETRRDLHYLTERDGWADLSAVRAGRVALLDGNAYFNRPGPRIYRAIEVLASVLHPERVNLHPEPVAWERQWWTDVAAPTS